MHQEHSVVGSKRVRGLATVEPLECRTMLSATYYVSPKGSDANAGTDPTHAWQHIQQAFNAATPGSTVDVLPGKYNEKLTLNVSGNATDGFITFQAAGKVIIDGRNQPGQNIIYIHGQNYVQIVGFDIRDDLNVSNGSGIRLTGADDHIEIRNNIIHNITGSNTMGITAYGTDPTGGISNLVVDGNQIFRCQPAMSEALTLNGNVHDFAVTNNYVHDVNNIGIDFIAGEGTSSDPSTDVARNGVCSGNRITRAHFKGSTRDAAGIFVDGGQNIVVEKNVSWGNDAGIEVGAVHAGIVASGVSVRDNLVYNNTRVGISVGGYDQTVGRVQNCTFTNNTLYHNDTKHTGGGEIRIQWASLNQIENNLISGGARDVLFNVESGGTVNTSDYNLFFSPGKAGSARFEVSGQSYSGLDAFYAAGGMDANSIFANPLLSGRNLHISTRSPAINAGDPLFTPAAGETDIDGQPRLLGNRVDIGADEVA